MQGWLRSLVRQTFKNTENFEFLAVYLYLFFSKFFKIIIKDKFYMVIFSLVLNGFNGVSMKYVFCLLVLIFGTISYAEHGVPESCMDKAKSEFKTIFVQELTYWMGSDPQGLISILDFQADFASASEYNSLVSDAKYRVQLQEQMRELVDQIEDLNLEFYVDEVTQRISRKKLLSESSRLYFFEGLFEKNPPLEEFEVSEVQPKVFYLFNGNIVFDESTCLFNTQNSYRYTFELIKEEQRAGYFTYQLVLGTSSNAK